MPASTRPPSAATIVAIMAAAALIGFLAGALLALAGPRTTDAADVTTPSPATTSTPTPTPTAGQTTAPVDAEIALTADRAAADTDELIRLEGVLRPGTGGVALQVQQSVDGIGFVDFPVSATTRADGSFGVWVRTGRVGSNEFRMVASLQGQQVVSNAVTVQVS
jgi:hypothetical protein